MKGIRYTLSQLPYDYDALQPTISKAIMELHHDKHHKKYVDEANKALQLLEDAREGKVQINIRNVLKDLSFNLNGHLLHEIFWNNMKRYEENSTVPEEIGNLLEANFSSVSLFQKEFEDAAMSIEGAGWVVLYKDMSGNLLISQIQNHNLLGINGYTPVLVNDLWEHAYYLDYQTDKQMYIKNWWNVVNWEDVLKRITTSN